jgi:hypothetical protein
MPAVMLASRFPQHPGNIFRAITIWFDGAVIRHTDCSCAENIERDSHTDSLKVD